MEQFDLNQVLVFTKVVEEQGFTGAARVLGLPKSTVSRRIAELERRLGARLLNRTTRKVSPTDVGREYYTRALRAVAELEEADQIVRQSQAEPRGTLRITAPADLAAEHLSALVGDFLRAYPKVSLSLDLTQRVVDLVEEGFDLALRAGRLRDSTLVARRLTRGRSRLFAAPGYLERRGRPKTLAALSSHDAVILGTELSTTWELLKKNRRHTVRVSGRVAARDFGFLRQATLGGLGVALLPERLGGTDVEAGRLHMILPEYTTDEVGMWIVYPSARHLSAKARAFVDFAVGSWKDGVWE